MWKLSFLVVVATFAVAARAQTHLSFKFQSAPERTSLLELYTSEGCSSCPPADVWLSRLKDSPRLWKDFAPVAFHVDYWNYLGWKDRWSEATFAERQRGYAQLWHSESIYTPEFVLDGKEWHNWVADKNGPKGDAEHMGILTVTSADTNHWQAAFVPDKLVQERYEIHAALLTCGVGSDVKAGENAGRRLNHDFVTVNFVQAGLTSSDGVAKGNFILDTPRFGSEKTLALTVWVTLAGKLEPLQAAGGWLVLPAKK